MALNALTQNADEQQNNEMANVMGEIEKAKAELAKKRCGNMAKTFHSECENIIKQR